MKIHEHSAGHITKMAAKPIYGKSPSKLFFSENRWTNFHETWYVAFGSTAHYRLFKWCPWVDLDLFYGKVKFGNISFYIENCHSDGFFDNFAACHLEIGWYTTKWVNIGYEVLLSPAKHHIDILGPDIRWAFTGPMILWFLMHWPTQTNLFSYRIWQSRGLGLRGIELPSKRKQRGWSASRLPRNWSAPLFSHTCKIRHWFYESTK